MAIGCGHRRQRVGVFVCAVACLYRGGPAGTSPDRPLPYGADREESEHSLAMLVQLLLVS